jgi:CheY-like chemotaxis protein
MTITHGPILVVDDDDSIRETLTEILSDQGYNALGFENGREALTYLQAGRPSCLILLDLMMPVMDGWQFLREREQNETLRAIPVVVVTAAASPDRAALASATAVLPKPVPFEELFRLIGTYCEQASSSA